MSVPRRAAFLGLDGVLLDDAAPHNGDPRRMRLLPGAADGVRLLHGAGYALIVVTNQPGVARGVFPPEALFNIEKHVRVLLARFADVPLTDFYACPYDPDGSIPAYARDDADRLPSSEMLLRAGREHRLDLAQSVCIGNRDAAIAGRRAGCRAVQLPDDALDVRTAVRSLLETP